MATATTAAGKRKRKRGTGTVPIGRDTSRAAAPLAWQNGGGAESFAEWARFLRRRRRPSSLARLLHCKDGNPLLWELPAPLRDHTQLAEQACQLERWTRAKKTDRGQLAEPVQAAAREWIATFAGHRATAENALDALAWCHALPRLATLIPREPWKQLLEGLSISAQQALDAEKAFFAEQAAPEAIWTDLLWCVELPLALSYEFPELDPCHKLGPVAAELLADSLSQVLDGAGCPNARNLGVLRQLFASWTRCLAMARAMPGIKIRKTARTEFSWLIQQVLRFTRRNGTAVLSPTHQEGADAASFRQLLRAALTLTNDDEDKALARLVVQGKRVADADLPDEAAYHSEWAELSVLRPDWSLQDPMLLVDYSAEKVRGELNLGEETMFSGEWQPSVAVNGVACEPTSGWEALCWFSDDDVDFLEIEADLTGGWKLQRQFLLARQDLFLYTADIMLGPEEGDLEYLCRLPLADAVRFAPAEETREGYLRGSSARALVIPVALPEWRIDRGRGELREVDGRLQLQQTARGRALCAATFFDLHRRRHRQALTWRQLTIGEQLKIIPTTEAVAYRVQVGPEQWLIYRSLTPPANRTVLGQNLSSEFLCARFLTDGDIDMLVEIE